MCVCVSGVAAAFYGVWALYALYSVVWQAVAISPRYTRKPLQSATFPFWNLLRKTLFRTVRNKATHAHTRSASVAYLDCKREGGERERDTYLKISISQVHTVISVVERAAHTRLA